ncbi:putative amino-acid ABC transporter-binding protein precursor [Pseudodesulfovibrio hydrargyri]|uniref:Putative amino-acid ABC transporter-binding protein n=1 Tax=Pseudodesulfovibrio hydrargyri TaxID=2125990 RepID=A0A1J5N146_9BACT|nr:transporter substrate-binding domain-containing protein [Pseudodesulfovibrio hydrargyri]OIQ51986.1 putative amino-acid ABC transporter-binding protein precursor [Pseudodesulfovibrio hydrargyri]
MATGYPPYQYLDDKGEPAGLDVEVTRLVLARLGARVRMVPGHWDDIVANLRLGRLDCVCGMEINRERMNFFAFTSPYYSRKVVIFVPRGETGIRSADDLVGKVVAGDRNSFVERYLKERGVFNLVRIVRTKTKEQSMRMLKEGKAVAAIAPLAVGRLLADREGLDVRVMDVGDPGSPVGFAVEKGNAALLGKLEKTLETLKREGVLQPVLDRWLR